MAYLLGTPPDNTRSDIAFFPGTHAHLRFISKQEQAMSAHSMADNLLNNDFTNFWKEVKSLTGLKQHSRVI